MQQEAEQTPQVIARQWQENSEILQALAKRLQSQPPAFAVTVARGSSDNAATFAKYLLETFMGVVTSSAAPSVLTVYGKTLNYRDSLVIGISQSGQSPDICETLADAKKAGAITVAFINKTNSPMADIAEYVIPLWAGEEKAVPATKTYLASLSAFIQFIAYYAKDKALIDCGQKLPQRMAESLQLNTNAFIDELKTIHTLLVLARGYGFPIAQEIALKLKETLSIHAEAISSAEVLHGPLALIKENHPILLLAQGDQSLPALLELAQRIKAMKANVLLTIPADKIDVAQHQTIAHRCLLLPPSLHPVCDPLLSAQALYPIIAKLTIARGLNPDHPEHLKKVTETR